MEIDLTILRDSINRTLDMIIEVKGPILTINNGYYWSVLDDDLYNMAAQPSSLGIGDLEFDYERVYKTYEEKDEMPMFLYWHAELLRAISIEHPTVFNDVVRDQPRPM